MSRHSGMVETELYPRVRKPKSSDTRVDSGKNLLPDQGLTGPSPSVTATALGCGHSQINSYPGEKRENVCSRH